MRPFWNRRLARELLAEFIGTFMIVQFGTGAVMSAVFGGALLGLFQVAAVWFIGVTLAICCTASISGAHLNPSITLVFAMFRPCSNFSWNKVLPYMLAQLLGAVFASWINLLMYYSKLRVFEEKNNIDRGSHDSVPAAKTFGEYYV
jgi:glycerol uptake facilitator-like aquaporin